MRKLVFLFLFVGLAAIISNPMLYAQVDHKGQGHVMVVPDGLTWGEGPASLPQGAKIAVIEGDPSKEGPFTMRGKLPANYKIPPHSHPGIEHVTVISGAFYMGLGETFDESKATKLPAGGFAVMDIGTKHFAFTKEETIVQIHGIGPWGINYVNPADDPRNKDKSQLETGN
jgi:hypothetical protein